MKHQWVKHICECLVFMSLFSSCAYCVGKDYDYKYKIKKLKHSTEEVQAKHNDSHRKGSK